MESIKQEKEKGKTKGSFGDAKTKTICKKS
jgi:hypothetical protein